MNTSLIAERTVNYNAQPAGLAAGTYFNGNAAASTTATKMAPGINGVGGIPISGAARALVLISLGTVGTGLVGTITAWVSSVSQNANASSSLYQIPNFSLSYADTDGKKILKGEIDLRGVTPTAPVAGDAELLLWIKNVKTGINDSIVVQLGDFMYEPTIETLDVKAPTTLSL